MCLLRYTPRTPLSGFVQCFWYSEGAPRRHAKERLLPNGEAAIIFNLCDDPIRIYDAQDLTRFSTYGNAVLSGARANCFVIDTSQQERVIGIQFQPGGVFPFLRMPVSEAENSSVALNDIWGGRASAVREQLLECTTIESMFITLERLLIEQLIRPLQLHPAVTFALDQFRRSAHAGRVTEVADRIGLSYRRFIELFRRQVGLPPKVFCRVRRFQRAVRGIHRRSQVDWVETALDCGYYDQAHFIHDFQTFSGLTPGGYRALATPHLNHVPIR
ncbi:MAG TPA: helix-turn-helix domain-containing protein [Bryobacteraceae bacterium]|jgi:AraC-like DNA-binding protein|nr:helix-turn-helix domain-containing protein [Bryobacteraceae bacterium]